MKDADRFKLLGQYKTPRVRVGAILSCESRDCDLVVSGYSDARIPWPVGYDRERGGPSSVILFGDLARAVRRESVLAICHWWGVGPSSVWRWRKALGVELANPGTHRLRSEYSREPWAAAARQKALAKARDPDRCRKIAESRRGKKRPPHVAEAVRRAHLGRRHTPAARRKMAAAARARAKVFLPCGRAWTPDEDELVRTLPAPEVARRTRRSLASVYSRRGRLGLPDGRRR